MMQDKCTIMLDNHLGEISDYFYFNNKNNQLKKWVWPSKDVP